MAPFWPKACKTCGVVIRWGLVGIFMWLLICQVQMGVDARRESDDLNSQLEQKELEKSILETNIGRLSNPESRLRLWKSEMMRYEPGEVWINFRETSGN